ncbi:hypothetical protein IMG5_024300, partial [Ichthyophthirius multifiliis]
VIIHTHLLDRLPGVDENSQKDGITLTVTGPENIKVLQKLTLYGKSKFSFSAQKGGNYKFCAKTTTSHWVKENKFIRYGIKLIVGEQEQQELKNAAKEEHINKLQQKVSLVQVRSKEFLDYQALNSRLEDDLTTQNVVVNDRVVLFTIIETIIILGSGIFQIISLKSFFQKKKFY